MLVCHCHQITDRDILRRAAEGARTLGDLSLSCRAGQSCGGCVATIQRLLTGSAGAQPTSGVSASEVESRGKAADAVEDLPAARVDAGATAARRPRLATHDATACLQSGRPRSARIAVRPSERRERAS